MTQSLALLGLLLFGVALRMLPVAVGVPGEFTGDGAYHARLIEEAVTHGSLPRIDELSDAPSGRNTASLLPLGLYSVGATLRAWLPAISADTCLQVMTAVAGALILIPVFFIARGVSLRPTAALIAAAAICIMPAHLHRTFAWWLRYDALGSLLALAHLAFLVWSFRSGSRVLQWGFALAAAGTLSLAAAVWRVPLVFPLIECAWLAAWMLIRNASGARTCMTVFVGAATIGLMASAYIRDQQYLLSRGWLLPLALLGSSWLPRRWSPISRGVGAVGLVLAAWLVGGHTAPGYEALGGTFLARISEWVGGTATDPVLRLMLSVEELSAVSPLQLLGPGYFGAFGFVAVIAGIVFFVVQNERRSLLSRLRRPEVALTTTLLFAMVALTLMFARTKVLAAPLVAISIGGLAQWLFGFAGSRRSRVVPVALGALVLAFAWVGLDAWRLMSTRVSALDPDLKSMALTIRNTTEPDAIIVTPWELGYDTQRSAGRATLMDGLLESKTSRTRILAFAQASMERGPQSLEDFCRAHSAHWLLVPPSTHLYGIASLVDSPLAQKVLAGAALSPQEADRTIIRMMVLGGDQGPFVERARHGGYRLMELKDELSWDLRNGDGIRVMNGVYFARLSVGKQVVTRTVVVN